MDKDIFSYIDEMTYDELLDHNKIVSSTGIMFLLLWWLSFAAAVISVIIDIDIIAVLCIGCTLFILSCINEGNKVKLRINERISKLKPK